MASLRSPWLRCIVSPKNGAIFPSTNVSVCMCLPSSTTTFKLCCALSSNNAESSEPTSPEAQTGPVDPVKLAFNKAKTYKEESGKSNPGSGIEQSDANGENSVNQGDAVDGRQKDLPVSLKIAMEKAKKYKQNKGVAIAETTQDSFSDGDLTEVEFIVGDATKFDAVTDPEPEQTKEEESELYKPTVSTWGVFPRPGNISKTFGGGRVIRPGEVLETDEEKAMREVRTKQLLAAYKKRTGLDIDPKLKSECEEALKDGDLLMNAGKLKEALPYYEKVMDKITFKISKHILMIDRSNEAQSMYEKLKSHPNAKAMEMMKFTAGSSSYSKNTYYQNYFDAFIENKSNYPLQDVHMQTVSLFYSVNDQVL
uniref:Uncharacterized protein n=1 Tax=Lotus japonicus TaxID=34305 RepID=Q8GSP4_LOTJA|nr:hypothetical protein [Lotus japonicus]